MSSSSSPPGHAAASARPTCRSAAAGARPRPSSPTAARSRRPLARSLPTRARRAHTCASPASSEPARDAATRERRTPSSRHSRTGAAATPPSATPCLRPGPPRAGRRTPRQRLLRVRDCADRPPLARAPRARPRLDRDRRDRAARHRRDAGGAAASWRPGRRADRRRERDDPAQRGDDGDDRWARGKHRPRRAGEFARDARIRRRALSPTCNPIRATRGAPPSGCRCRPPLRARPRRRIRFGRPPPRASTRRPPAAPPPP